MFNKTNLINLFQLKAARTLGLLSIQIFLAWMPYLFLTIFKITQSETSKILSEKSRIYFSLQIWNVGSPWSIEPWKRAKLCEILHKIYKFLKGGAINMSIILGITKQCPESNCIFNDESRISQICLQANLYWRRSQKNQRFYLCIKSCLHTHFRSRK